MMSFLSYFCIQDDLHVQDGLIQRVTRPKLSGAKTPSCQDIEIEKSMEAGLEVECEEEVRMAVGEWRSEGFLRRARGQRVVFVRAAAACQYNAQLCHDASTKGESWVGNERCESRCVASEICGKDGIKRDDICSILMAKILDIPPVQVRIPGFFGELPSPKV